jgi:DICT domain-containing protein
MSNPDPEAATLSIGEVSRRTGVGSETLRAWERRHGFPVPERLPRGHRRYSERDVQTVGLVAEGRAGGLSVAAAIRRATAVPEQGPASIFAELRRARPDLQPTRLPKPLLTALSHAIEDESLARAERPLLFAAFQRERFYRQAQSRWRDLAATADQAVVLADFVSPRPAANPAELALDPTSPMGREWAIVCHSEAHGAFLAGWELPGQSNLSDHRRVFEVLWSVEPGAVTAAAVAAARVVSACEPELGRDAERLIAKRTAPHPAAQLALGSAITSRLLVSMRESHV